MPQLAPEPWFLIFFSSWLIFILMSTKILNHSTLSDPNLKTPKTSYNYWTWPWQ